MTQANPNVGKFERKVSTTADLWHENFRKQKVS